MSIVSFSLASNNVQAPRGLAETPRPARRADAPAAEPVERHRGRESGAGRLEQAITTALQTLGVGQPAVVAAPTASAAAPTATAAEALPTAAAAGDAATAEPVTLQSAVHEFAEALYAALRDVGGGRGQGHGQGHGHGHAYGHHDDHGWRGRGYGSLANRLENLAATLGTPAPAAPAPAPVATPATAPVTAPDSTATDAAAAPAEAADVTAAAAPADAPVVATTAPAPAPAPALPSALLAAFTQLQGLLQPTEADTAATDPAAALKQFLQTLAQGLKGAVPEGDALRSGSLINLSA